MPTVNIDVEIEVYCASCGDGMCGETKVVQTRTRDVDSFRVNACERCLKKAKDSGYDDGYSDGYDAGLEAAKKQCEDEDTK